MGRRKIEIKAIKDDRNRSVTFLKRKGGLFKKAHELSVLCSVDVAVVIFGNNKKLYEYSSSDIGEIMNRYQYYGAANEHKGPADFNGKGKLDDDDDDDDGSGPSHHGSVEPQMMPPQFQNHAFQHVRHHTPSASPPIPNGVFPPYPQQRQHTPQPGQPGSRPTSRNDVVRTNSNFAPQPQHPQPLPPNGYAFMPNPSMYNPQSGPVHPPHPNGLPPHMQQAPMHSLPGAPQPGGPQYPSYGPPPPQQQQQQQPPPPPPQPPQQHPHSQQVQQLYAEEQRKTSMPPTFPQERPSSRSPPQPQPHGTPQQQPQQLPSHQETEEHPPAPQQMLEPVKRMSVKSRSIFTPIDESRSILSQHWASSTTTVEPNRGERPNAPNRAQSVDAATVPRIKTDYTPPPPPQRAQTENKNRNVSMSSSVEGFTPPSQANLAQLGGGKRPVLKVQIPDEPSDGGSATAGSNSSQRSSPNAAGSNDTRQNGHTNSDSHSSGVVLPPPSPSASALLSAGASGPPNPFARPHPVPQASQSNSNNSNHIDTPVSSLPSRFMNNDFLPSPSSFYPDWNYRAGDSNTLPSPLNFATPVVGTGPNFLREDSGGRESGNNNGKRKTPDAEGENADVKRPKLVV
ncbi:SRF-type transcription factor RlmA [Drepanopeziza brunnea f. sp. 'multigermtubi' MB_m1]|uniref:SRF-type transcription factor RlmA n=1 Tax=Marssonina brunnea f. sp. multigermtubi (strain MB_m1) TaxID=1072389 RepID=K1WKJ1_MARBU|nr:SRF-type transcription factor RlmA [Drepanopeziza brunnea f. sp. 'multigermtubi' MB_m1]EKD18150.1 SRF-type transcription factor RlmA [Drepanopeziza brunnea f. sp. 'multigermtubi' MB_m1]